MRKPITGFTVYIEWQCDKCHAINHTDPAGTARTDEVLAVRLPLDVTCSECKTAFEVDPYGPTMG